MASSRLLIASPFAGFLAECTPALSSEFEIQRANSEDVLLFLAKEWAPQIIVLDGDSPLFNSCSKLRSRFPVDQLGVVMITREFTPPREERALRSGCDQVLSGPGLPHSLCLRLQMLANRVSGGPSIATQGLHLAGAQPKSAADPIQFGEIQVLPKDHIIKRGAQVVTMTPIQFKLLLMFLHHREKLLSRQWIKESVWESAEISLRSIDAQISKLRKIVPEIDPHLVNIYGKGYVFTDNRRQAA